MAKRWAAPDDKVDDNERIGRRLFDEPLLVGVSSQPSYSGLLLTHFEETRGNEISVDRLGRTGVEKKIVTFLSPLAVNQGAKDFASPKSFDGWSTISVRELRRERRRRKLDVFASPVTDSGAENPYHAHILRPTEIDPDLMALHLRHLFVTHGAVERSPSRQLSWRDRLVLFIDRAAGYLKAQVKGTSG